jgi:mRNA interferase RelE/StbE
MSPGRQGYGSPDLRRLRVGRYRVFYMIDPQDAVLRVTHLGRVS